MGVFTGNEMLFTLAGVLLMGFIWLFFSLHGKHGLRWHTWLLGGAGAVMLIFAVLWAVSSILEGEPQAANMGLLIFGVPALLLVAFSLKSALSGRNA